MGEKKRVENCLRGVLYGYYMIIREKQRACRRRVRLNFVTTNRFQTLPWFKCASVLF